jgi:serine phosphatase RsbU (regulator of sigma subunit)
MSESSQNAPRLLIVDDDDLIIQSLRGLFTLETDYEIYDFNEPEKALQEVARRPIDLVISDFLMPRMNGVDFLKKVRELQPDATRILLTGFADKENAIRAINEVGLYHYLEKPWSNQDLLLLVRNALQHKSLRIQLSQKVSEFERLMREHSELSTRHRSIQRDLEMAARVQQSLLPARMPAVEGYCLTGFYESCAALGGDYYDFLEKPEELVILVADVSGHGVQAALSSMLLKASFQEAAARADGPVRLLEEMNARLARFLPSSMYACAASLWISPGKPRVRIANAGVPYPIVLRAASERVDELAMSGVPLALLPEVMPDAYDYRELELQSGDVLLVTSDGLGDIRNAQNEFFHDGPLQDALRELRGKAGPAVVEGLMRFAAAFRDDAASPDDVCMVALTKT